MLTQDEENQIESAKGFKTLLESQSLDKNSLNKLFSATLLILKQWSQNVLVAWVEVFDGLMQKLNFVNVEKECVNLIFMLSDHSQPISSRFISGMIIAIVAEV